MGEVEEEVRFILHILMLNFSVIGRSSSKNSHGDMHHLLPPPYGRQDVPTVLRFHSFVSLSPLESQYPLATHLFTFLPSFLPLSFTHLINLSFLPSLIEDQLTGTKRLQTWVGAGDNMKNIAYHEKLIRGLIVRPTSIKPTLLVSLCLLLLLPFNGFPPPSQFGTSYAEVIREVFLSFFF